MRKFSLNTQFPGELCDVPGCDMRTSCGDELAIALQCPVNELIRPIPSYDPFDPLGSFAAALIHAGCTIEELLAPPEQS